MTEIREFGTPPPASRAASLSGAASSWRVAEETPVAFIYNGRNYAVMMTTPADLADFAVGFTLSERVASHFEEIISVEIHYGDAETDLRIQLAAPAIERFDARQARRNLVGRAGCGVCGVDSSEIFFAKLPEVSATMVRIPELSVSRALAALSAHQPLNAETKSVHAAAMANGSGEILLAREDVGRHNALDKLLGACVRRGIARNEGFVVVSSRCSYEIVEKAARLGVCAVASISAPTAFAIRKAGEANLALYALAGKGVVSVVI